MASQSKPDVICT